MVLQVFWARWLEMGEADVCCYRYTLADGARRAVPVRAGDAGNAGAGLFTDVASLTTMNQLDI